MKKYILLNEVYINEVISIKNLILSARDESQDHEEEINDVNVNVERSQDVVLGRDGELVLATKHELRVEDEIHRE